MSCSVCNQIWLIFRPLLRLVAVCCVCLAAPLGVPRGRCVVCAWPAPPAVAPGGGVGAGDAGEVVVEPVVELVAGHVHDAAAAELDGRAHVRAADLPRAHRAQHAHEPVHALLAGALHLQHEASNVYLTTHSTHFILSSNRNKVHDKFGIMYFENQITMQIRSRD